MSPTQQPIASDGLVARSSGTWVRRKHHYLDRYCGITAINPSGLWKKRLGDWVLNPYVGCEHGCYHCYCPAMPGVKFNNHGHKPSEWGTYLYPKVGIVDALRQQLRSFTPDKAKRTEWGDGWVLVSFLTDCYTPTEAKLKLTRQCLELLLEAGHKVRIQTRSALVERDFDLPPLPAAA